MGMDMIGVGFTVDQNKQWQEDKVKEAIAQINFEDMEEISKWDYAGLFDFTEWDEEECRDYMTEGFKVAQEILNYRATVTFTITDTTYFVFAGGGSWGDDPFEGFTELDVFLNYVDFHPEVRKYTPILGLGIVLPNSE